MTYIILCCLLGMLGCGYYQVDDDPAPPSDEMTTEEAEAAGIPCQDDDDDGYCDAEVTVSIPLPECFYSDVPCGGYE